MTNRNCLEPLEAPCWLMSKAGIWPRKTLTSLTVIKLVLHIFLDIFVAALIIHNMINAVRSNNIILFNWMTCVLLPLINYYAKVITLFSNRRHFFLILEDLKSSVFNMHSTKLNRYIQQIYNISRILLKYFAVVMAVFILIFSVLPFVANTTMALPPSFDLGKYGVLYKVWHLFFTIYFAINSTACDVLYMSLIALCSAQISILRDKLGNIVRDAKENYTNLYNWEITVEFILRESVILHETINRFVKKLDALLSLPLFVQYIVGCFIICNTILQLTIMGERNSTNIIGLCGYSSIVFAQMTAYHWIGNEIIFRSEKIIESCYLSNWYELNIKSQKTLIILMERAKRPLIIKIYKLVFVSLVSLGAIVRSSYSVFALIKAGYK